MQLDCDRQKRRTVALRGDPAHPYTRGSLCNKVENYLPYAGSSDRLLYPMLRTGPKGSGEFTRTSWDEALDRIATEFRDVIAKHSAEASQIR
jgi:anaerobic selenocysteine-containing dehydrogenase